MHHTRVGVPTIHLEKEDEMKHLKLRSVALACLLAALLCLPALPVQAVDGSPGGFVAWWSDLWSSWTTWWPPPVDETTSTQSTESQSVTSAGEANSGATVGTPTSPETQSSAEEEEGDIGGAMDPFG